MRCVMTYMLMCVLCVMMVCATAQGQKADDKLIDHGVAVPLAERRGVVTTQDANGKNLAIACSLDLNPRGWILVTDIDSGETTQIQCPEGVGNSPPYGSLMHTNGKFYTTQGSVLLEFDPTSRDWTFHGTPSPAASCYLSFTEGPDGMVWAGNAYTAGLISFDPEAREAQDHGRLDEAQKYLSALAVDDAGWVYGGIGTARCNIVAYNPETGEKIQIVDEAKRKVGTANVYRGEDGKVYGRAELADGAQFYRLYDGKAEVIQEADMGPKAPTGAIGWGNKRGSLPDGRQLVNYSMTDKWLEVRDPETGETKHIEFDYESEGTHLRVMTAGPDGKVYGNSAHPSRGVTYDPETDVLEYQRGAIARKGFATQGKYIIGGHYGGGRLYVFDTTMPWNMAPVAASLRGGIPAMELTKLAESDAGKIDYIESHDLVLFRADDYGGQIHFPLEAGDDGQYYLIIAPYKSPGYCTVQFSLDGTEIGEPYPGYAKAAESGPFQTFGPLQLKAGEHRLSVKTIKAEAGNPWIGINAISLTKEQPDGVIAEAQPPNPRLVATFSPDINVPWGAAAHPDGQHVMISGPPGYGYLGGGIGIYNLETDEEMLLTHEQLIENHCVTAMAPLDNGDIVCGSSVGGGHGTTAVAKEAVLFVLDWETKEISFQTVPVAGASAIRLMRTGPDGLVYCIADASGFFVFDPGKKEVVHDESLGEYGGTPVNGMERGPDGNIYVIFSEAILKIAPGSFEVEKIADTPASPTAGIAVVGGRVYFAIGSHLWSAKL